MRPGGLMLSGGHQHDRDDFEKPLAGERFLDEHIPSRLKRSTHIIATVLTGQENDRNIRKFGVALERLANIIAVDAGHHNIEQNNVGFKSSGFFDGLVGSVFGLDLEAVLGQEGFDYLSYFGLIVHNQNLGGIDINFVRHNGSALYFPV